MRELLARCHTHLDDADQIISGQSLLCHMILPKAQELHEERQWNGAGSTVCFETLKDRTKLHLLPRQTKALTSDTHHVHDELKFRLYKNPTAFPTHLLLRSKATNVCCCWCRFAREQQTHPMSVIERSFLRQAERVTLVRTFLCIRFQLYRSSDMATSTREANAKNALLPSQPQCDRRPVSGIGMPVSKTWEIHASSHCSETHMQHKGNQQCPWLGTSVKQLLA
jgi:hypothetical protein